jgi:hypothetical protein
MANRDSSVTSAEAFAAQCQTIEALVQHMIGLVDEWAEQRGMVYSVAEAGRVYASKADADGEEHATVEGSVFQTIAQLTEDTFYSNHLHAALSRLQELLGKPRRGT